MNKTHIRRFNTKLKAVLATSITLLCLSVATTAHADFRKALDAYQARDGATMLKEVKDAVNKKSDDGLMLLLMATNMDAATSDYDETTKQSKSTLRAILPPPKWDEMREFLVQATNNSTADTQYYLNVKSQFSSDFVLRQLQLQQPNTSVSSFTNLQRNTIYESTKAEFKKRGSYGAFSDSPTSVDRVKYAELGDAFSQLMIGLQYHSYVGDFACDIQDIKYINSLCSKKDEEKGDYWLKKAVKSYEASAHDDIKILYDAMCNFYKKTKGETDVNTTSWCSLVNSNQPATLPDWVKQARSELTQPDAPIIKAYFKDAYPAYELEVYKDGRVMVIYGSNVTNYKDKLYVLTSPKNKINKFIQELEKLKVSTWDTTSQFYGFPTDCNGNMTELQILINHRQKLTRFSLITCFSKSLSEPYFRNIQIAKLKSLLEKHFDVNRLQYKLGNSKERISSRLSRESEWNALSKMEIKK